MPIRSGSTPETAHDTSRTNGRRPSALGILARRDEAHGSAVVLPAGVAGGDRRLGVLAQPHRLEGRERLCGDIGAGVLVNVDDDLAPADVRGHRHDLLGERAVLLGLQGALVGLHGELVLLLAGDGVLTAQVLRGLEHAPLDVVTMPARSGARAREHVVHGEAARGAAADVGGVESGVAHAFGAAGDHDGARAGLHAQHRVDDGLQPGSAAPVDLDARDPHRQAGVQGDDSPDRRGLAVGAAVAEDHVVDVHGVDAGALEQRPQHRDTQVGRGDSGERASVAADGGPQRFADDGIGHRPAFLEGSSPVRTTPTGVCRACQRRGGRHTRPRRSVPTRGCLGYQA